MILVYLILDFDFLVFLLFLMIEIEINVCFFLHLLIIWHQPEMITAPTLLFAAHLSKPCLFSLAIAIRIILL